MRIGIGSYTYTWAVGVPGAVPPAPLTAADLVARAVGFGVPIVELCDNLAPGDLPPAERADLIALARRSAVELRVGIRGSAPEVLRAALDLAEEFGSPTLRVVPDDDRDRPAPAELLRRIRSVRGELERRNITLALENHDRFPARSLADLVRRADSPRVGVCLDTVNSFGALEGPEAVLDALIPFAVEVHIKDFVIRRHSHRMGFTVEGTAAGAGMLDIPGLIDRLGDRAADVPGILELWTSPLASTEATIAEEARRAEESIAFLHRVTADPSHCRQRGEDDP